MDNNAFGSSSGEIQKPASEKLLIFFTNHLDRIYSAKVHMVNRLPSLVGKINDPDLSMGISQTISNVENQISRMDSIYELLNTLPPKESLPGLKGLIEEAFLAIETQDIDEMVRDLSVLFYLQNIENVEAASFQLLQMAGVKLKNTDISRLLLQNYEEAKKNRTLLLLISTKYISTV
ncbi:DUF892 family protein [Pedobacter mendelii]|uniref:DUF892 family protein n=1 Tax=Pedobacter mendelii TaxID=1908240 RepID=UPI00361673CD